MNETVKELDADKTLMAKTKMLSRLAKEAGRQV
jgi:hypothetical protein